MKPQKEKKKKKQNPQFPTLSKILSEFPSSIITKFFKFHSKTPLIDSIILLPLSFLHGVASQIQAPPDALLRRCSESHFKP